MKKLLIFALIIAVGGGIAWFFWGKKDTKIEGAPFSIRGTHYRGGGLHVVEGIVVLPNPCFRVEVAADTREDTDPQEVLLRFTAEQTADTCVQVISESPFRVSFSAGDNVVVRAEVNGTPADLQLEHKERTSAVLGEEFTLAKGEKRWGDEFPVEFLGVIEDSRCPELVVCIRAGTVTVEVRAGDETIWLRAPGEGDVPNAAVVGSYVITLIEVSPLPKQNDIPISERSYRATLRIDIHDIKG